MYMYIHIKIVKNNIYLCIIIILKLEFFMTAVYIRALLLVQTQH